MPSKYLLYQVDLLLRVSNEFNHIYYIECIPARFMASTRLSSIDILSLQSLFLKFNIKESPYRDIYTPK